MTKAKSWEQIRDEALWVLALSPTSEELERQQGSATVKAPTPVPPPWLTGEAAKKLARKPGHVEFAPVPEQCARRLRVVVRDELEDSFTAAELRRAGGGVSEHEFRFDGQLGGTVGVYRGGRDPVWQSENCSGRFSPFSTKSMALVGDGDGRTLVVVERFGGEDVERVIPCAGRNLHVEVIEPDAKQPWIMHTVTTSFSLDDVTSIELADVEVG